MQTNLISLSTMRRVVIPELQVRQIVKYTGDMANQSGVGAIAAIRNTHGLSYDVHLADGREFLASMIQLDRWQVSSQFAEPAHMDFLRAAVESKKALDQANKTSAAQSFTQAKDRIKRENPHLIAVKDGDYSSHVLAAKNIRIELKRAYPGVKFSVTSKSYSGGNSIDVHWTDGPNTKQVDAIIQKYQGGSFDGMTDCYDYADTPWTDVFGDAKYVHSSRSYSDEMVASRLRFINDRYSHGMDQPATLQDYKTGGMWHVKHSGNVRIGKELNRALSKHTYCIEKATTA